MELLGLSIPVWVIQLSIALIVLFGAFVVGQILNRLVIGRLAQLAQRTAWDFDDLLVGTVRGVPIALTMMLGIYIVLAIMPIEPALRVIGEKALTVILGMTLTLVVSRIAVVAVNTYFSASFSKEHNLPPPALFSNVLRSIVFLFGIIIVLESIGVPVGPALAALGVAGLAVSLALQDTLSNIFAGAQLIIAQQIRTGHYIRVDDSIEGYLEDINWRSSQIRQVPTNNTYIVPNSKILNAITLKFHDRDQEGTSFAVLVGVSYASDLQHVERVVLEEARQLQADFAEAEPSSEPFVRFYEFGDSSINLRVFIRATTYGNAAAMRHELIKRLHRRFDHEGIEIPFPQRTVHMRQEVPNQRVYLNDADTLS